jgi:hypothetical protein
MPCGCSKRQAPAPLSDREQKGEPEDWGPLLWKVLHRLGEVIGSSGNKVIDTDEANYTENVINMLPMILPCPECQAHTATYLQSNPLTNLKGLYGTELKNKLSNWVFLFHNHVRVSKGKEPFETILAESVQKCEYQQLILYITSAVRQNEIKIEHWKKWYSYLERLRILTVNLVF